jgi:uncharacterized protein YjgD (DUF1641 family)
MTNQTETPLTATVNSNDLLRLVELAQVVSAAQDAMSDDIVMRLSSAMSEGIALLDRINRSGIARALPAITQLVENGDLDRLVSLGRFMAAVEDSLSDDIVTRLSVVATEMASLVDNLARSRLIEVFGREDVQKAIINVAEATCAADDASAALPMPKGGLIGMWQLLNDPGTQDALRLIAMVSWKLRKR